MDTVVIFEGIGTLDTAEGVAHDVYIKVRTECLPGAIRWFGQFEWMGEKPKDFIGGGFHDLVLSDSRECQIRVARFAEDNGSYLFLGKGLPPGFEMFVPEMVTAELESSTPTRRRLLPTSLATIAFVLFMAGVWDDEHRVRLVVSALAVSFVSLCVSISREARRVKSLPEVKDE